MNFPWTDERTKQLKAAHAAGLRFSQIAERLGVSRNAVIGKASRLGLARLEPQNNHPKTKTPRPRKSNFIFGGLPSRRKTAPGSVASAETTSDSVVQAPVIPVRERVKLEHLKEHHCRWPLGDPGKTDFAYCGRQRELAKLPYCRDHMRVGYRPASPRRTTNG